MTERIIADVLAEVKRVDEIRGLDLSTPWGSGSEWSDMAQAAREEYDIKARSGEATFALALREECYEALAEMGVKKLRAELVQVAAVAVRWIRAIDAHSPMGGDGA